MDLIQLPAEVVTGLITAVIALIGIIYTQHQAGKREKSRVAEDRKLQRELWERDRRKEAHLAFLAEHHRLAHWMAMYTRVGLESAEEPQPDWMKSFAEKLLEVQVFGSQEVAVAGEHLYVITQRLQDGTVGAMIEADKAAEKFRRLVQRDLGLAETTFPRWDDGDEEAATV